MTTEIEIIAVGAIISILLGIAIRIDERKPFIIVSSISVLLFIIGVLISSQGNEFPHRLFYVPAFVTAIIKFTHILFRYFFNEPYYVNLRGSEYPEHKKNNRNGFVRFMNSLVSMLILIIVMAIYYLTK